jgi:hypothetical protein
VLAGGRKLKSLAENGAGEGFRFDPATGALRIRRLGAREVLISSD